MINVAVVVVVVVVMGGGCGEEKSRWPSADDNGVLGAGRVKWTGPAARV